MSLEITSVKDSFSGYSSDSVKAKSEKATTENTVKPEEGAVYEKSASEGKATYSINKMNAEDRAALVNQLKADQEQRQNQLKDLVSQLLGQQANTFANANDMWKVLASGEFTVDAATKEQAQKDISEDGYWGVKQTSQRLFDFASALAGDDVEKMKKMQNAMMKGYEMATGTWGRELPSISKDTIDAANKLFDDYYASKEEQNQ